MRASRCLLASVSKRLIEYMPSATYRIAKRALSKLGLWEPISLAWLHDVRRLASVSRGDKCVFQIVGVPRSGTTVLAAKLSNHPRMICLNEPFLVWRETGEITITQTQRRWGFAEKVSMVPHKLIEELCLNSALSHVGFKETFRTPRLNSHFPNDSFLKGIVHAKAVEKTVAIVRNPKDVWNSHRKKQLKFRPDARLMLTDGFMHNWNEYVRWVIGEGLFWIKYEDLVAQPEESFARIAEYIGFDFLPEMLGASGRLMEVTAAKPHEQTFFHSSVGSHRRGLSGEDCAFIDERCHDQMAQCGYSTAVRVTGS
jgi:sulfotransferase family protein